MYCKSLEEAEKKVIDLRNELPKSVTDCIKTRNKILEFGGNTYCLLTEECPYKARSNKKYDYCAIKKPYLFNNNL